MPPAAPTALNTAAALEPLEVANPASPGANDAANDAGDPLPFDWPHRWQQCVEILSELSQDRPGVFPRCNATLACGHACCRTVHVMGGTVECACNRCGNGTVIMDEEYARWRSLRDAIRTSV